MPVKAPASIPPASSLELADTDSAARIHKPDVPERELSKGRMEAFSDGVIAILITIMVLELRVPQEVTWRALQPGVPVFFAYVLSFVFLGIYWANHHHMLQLAERVNGGILWANQIGRAHV